MKAAGLTHGPFYNHFSSKEELLTDCIARASRKTVDFIEHFEPTVDGIEAYREWYLGASHRDNRGTGCIIASLGTEAGHDDAIKPSLTAHVRSIFATLATHFPWSPKRKARSESIRMFAAMVGAIVLARAVDDEDLSNEILEEMREALS